MFKRKTFFTMALIVSLLGASIASAAGEVIPVSSLQPAVTIEKPTLTPVGGKLIFSDTPEMFSETGAFYRDSAEGEFRVFWHHQNVSEDTTHTVSAAVTNLSSEEVMLFSKGSGVGTSIYVNYAGQLALRAFMKTYGTTKYLATLSPGESYFVEAATDPGLTTSGIAQFNAVTKNGNNPAEVTVTVLGYETKPEHPEQVPILPEEGGQLVRGTFPHFDRIGTITYRTSMGNAVRPVDSAAYGQWQDDMPGEYEVGWDAVDGKPVINNGNYGVIYHWTMDFVNDAHNPRTINMYLTPSGGWGSYVLQWNQEVHESGWLSYMDAWNFNSFTLGANGGTIKAKMSLVGGSSGPQTLYFTNKERK
ncbi:hypothetical protein [Paenibacillus thermotolerans]|uniref:hypothetical protein n=1 Tax=Paenibacillus thermotolerans TaxID=3027807 RepID=UPI002367D337|nr:MULTISPECIES: hypothetical protein [unclassified Paenibacillus]